MPVTRTQFEWLLLHSRLLPELALSLMAQDILQTPQEQFSAALSVSGARTDDALQASPGEVVDWFGTSDLSDEQLRELRESAERELTAFDDAQRQHPDDVAPVSVPGIEETPLDFERALEVAYAQRDAVTADAQAAFERIDPMLLDALLQAVDGGATLTDRMDMADLVGWLQLMQRDDPALAGLLDYVLKAASSH